MRGWNGYGSAALVAALALVAGGCDGGGVEDEGGPVTWSAGDELAPAAPEAPAPPVVEGFEITWVELTPGDGSDVLRGYHMVTVRLGVSGVVPEGAGPVGVPVVVGLVDPETNALCYLGRLEPKLTADGTEAFAEAELHVPRACEAMAPEEPGATLEVYPLFTLDPAGKVDIVGAEPGEMVIGSPSLLVEGLQFLGCGPVGEVGCQLELELAASAGLQIEAREIELSSSVLVLPPKCIPHPTEPGFCLTKQGGTFRQDEPALALNLHARALGVPVLDEDGLPVNAVGLAGAQAAFALRPSGSSAAWVPLHVRHGQNDTPHTKSLQWPTMRSGSTHVHTVPIHLTDGCMGEGCDPANALTILRDGAWADHSAFDLRVCVAAEAEAPSYGGDNCVVETILVMSGESEDGAGAVEVPTCGEGLQDLFCETFPDPAWKEGWAVGPQSMVRLTFDGVSFTHMNLAGLVSKHRLTLSMEGDRAPKATINISDEAALAVNLALMAAGVDLDLIGGGVEPGEYTFGPPLFDLWTYVAGYVDPDHYSEDPDAPEDCTCPTMDAELKLPKVKDPNAVEDPNAEPPDEPECQKTQAQADACYDACDAQYGEDSPNDPLDECLSECAPGDAECEENCEDNYEDQEPDGAVTACIEDKCSDNGEPGNPWEGCEPCSAGSKLGKKACLEKEWGSAEDCECVAYIDQGLILVGITIHEYSAATGNSLGATISFPVGAERSYEADLSIATVAASVSATLTLGLEVGGKVVGAFGDTEPDYVDTCAIGPTDTRCGSHETISFDIGEGPKSCYCDAVCTEYGDCCQDYERVCIDGDPSLDVVDPSDICTRPAKLSETGDEDGNVVDEQCTLALRNQHFIGGIDATLTPFITGDLGVEITGEVDLFVAKGGGSVNGEVTLFDARLPIGMKLLAGMQGSAKALDRLAMFLIATVGLDLTVLKGTLTMNLWATLSFEACCAAEASIKVLKCAFTFGFSCKVNCDYCKYNPPTINKTVDFFDFEGFKFGTPVTLFTKITELGSWDFE